MMLKLNLLPVDELKTVNVRHNKSLKLLVVISMLLLSFATIIVIAKLYSLNTLQNELTAQLNELADIEEQQKGTLDNLHKKQENIMENITRSDNNVDVAQFLRLLIHTKSRNTVIYEIKATAKQIEFIGFSNNRASVIDFSEQLKKSSLVQEITNFAINKSEKKSKQSKYPLSFFISVNMKRGGRQ